MCDNLVWSFDAIKSINWLEIIKALGPYAAAFIGFLALQNWRRQDKAKRQAEFLDELIEAAHAYIAEIYQPVAQLHISKIGMESHVPTWEQGDEADKAVKGAIAYIQKRGEIDGKQLFDILGAMRPSTIKLRSLIVKGQVFKFREYAKCQNAINMLIWLFHRIEAYAGIIGSSTWNWENTKVLDRLREQIALDPNELKKYLEESNVAIIEFSRDNYKKIYG